MEHDAVIPAAATRPRKFPAAFGPRAPSTLITIEPSVVSRVTLVVSPAAAGGGALVGQLPPADGADEAAAGGTGSPTVDRIVVTWPPTQPAARAPRNASIASDVAVDLERERIMRRPPGLRGSRSPRTAAPLRG